MCALKYMQLLKRYIQIELYSRIWQFLVAYQCNDGFELVPMLQLNWISHDSMNNSEIQLRFCTVERARKTEKHFWDILWSNFCIALSFLMNLSSILGIFQKWITSFKCSFWCIMRGVQLLSNKPRTTCKTVHISHNERCKQPSPKLRKQHSISICAVMMYVCTTLFSFLITEHCSVQEHFQLFHLLMIWAWTDDYVMHSFQRYITLFTEFLKWLQVLLFNSSNTQFGN